MWFQLGGHPSIVLPAPLRHEGQQVTQEVNPFSLVPAPASTNHKPVGYLRLEGTPHSLLRASTQGCTEPQRVHIPWNKDAATSRALASNHHFNALVPLTIETFAHEALIFDQHQVTAVHVLDDKEQRFARVVSSAPAWLVWRRPTNLRPSSAANRGMACPIHKVSLANGKTVRTCSTPVLEALGTDGTTLRCKSLLSYKALLRCNSLHSPQSVPRLSSFQSDERGTLFFFHNEQKGYIPQ